MANEKVWVTNNITLDMLKACSIKELEDLRGNLERVKQEKDVEKHASAYQDALKKLEERMEDVRKLIPNEFIGHKIFDIYCTIEDIDGIPFFMNIDRMVKEGKPIHEAIWEAIRYEIKPDKCWPFLKLNGYASEVMDVAKILQEVKNEQNI